MKYYNFKQSNTRRCSIAIPTKKSKRTLVNIPRRNKQKKRDNKYTSHHLPFVSSCHKRVQENVLTKKKKGKRTLLNIPDEIIKKITFLTLTFDFRNIFHLKRVQDIIPTKKSK